MIKVGITGGIGSGKSMVCKLLQTLGYPIYSADERAKVIINTNNTIISSLKEKFGEDIYINTSIDKKKLAQLIFNNTENLNFVNQLIHPIVYNDFIGWTKQQKTSIVFQEAALIFESGIYKHLDYTISIIAPEKIRIKRVVKRDNITQKEVIARMKNQISDDQRIKLSDFIIYNDDKKLILPQLLEILQQIKV